MTSSIVPKPSMSLSCSDEISSSLSSEGTTSHESLESEEVSLRFRLFAFGIGLFIGWRFAELVGGGLVGLPVLILPGLDRMSGLEVDGPSASVDSFL